MNNFFELKIDFFSRKISIRPRKYKKIDSPFLKNADLNRLIDKNLPEKKS